MTNQCFIFYTPIYAPRRFYTPGHPLYPRVYNHSEEHDSIMYAHRDVPFNLFRMKEDAPNLMPTIFFVFALVIFVILAKECFDNL